MRAAVGVARARRASCSGSRPASCSGRWSGSRPGRRPRPTRVGLDLPGTGSLPHRSGSRSSLVALTGRPRPARADAASAAPAPTLGVRTARRAAARLDERGLHEAAAARARGGAAAASARSPCAAEGGVVQEVSYSGRVPHLIDERLYRPVAALALAGRAPRAATPERQSRDVRRVPDRARSRRCSPPRGSGLIG